MHVLSSQASDAQKEKYDHNMLRPLVRQLDLDFGAHSIILSSIGRHAAALTSRCSGGGNTNK